jgi:L-ascorbate metabolism protein UlaG (beta-lactamase superfamily)
VGPTSITASLCDTLAEVSAVVYPRGDRVEDRSDPGRTSGGRVHLTKYTHSCVALRAGGGTLLVDPGIWTEPEAWDGVDAVLLTHEHADHMDAVRVAALAADGVPVFAPVGAVLGDLPEPGLTRVSSGDAFEAAGFAVRAVGGRHAEIHGGLPQCANLGYLVDSTPDGDSPTNGDSTGDGSTVYHPGDSCFVPDGAVHTLLVPLQAPWLKLTEALDFARAVAPQQVIGMHDGLLNERGLGITNRWFGTTLGPTYRYLFPGDQA